MEMVTPSGMDGSSMADALLTSRPKYNLLKSAAASTDDIGWDRGGMLNIVVVLVVVVFEPPPPPPHP
jgi:hypothetical protein